MMESHRYGILWRWVERASPQEPIPNMRLFTKNPCRIRAEQHRFSSVGFVHQMTIRHVLYKCPWGARVVECICWWKQECSCWWKQECSCWWKQECSCWWKQECSSWWKQECSCWWKQRLEGPAPTATRDVYHQSIRTWVPIHGGILMSKDYKLNTTACSPIY